MSDEYEKYDLEQFLELRGYYPDENASKDVKILHHRICDLERHVVYKKEMKDEIHSLHEWVDEKIDWELKGKYEAFGLINSLNTQVYILRALVIISLTLNAYVIFFQ